MDETWVWRYHSIKKGVAPKVSVKSGALSAKGERLIVVHAITNHAPLRHEPLTALWAYEYNKKGDYHDAMISTSFRGGSMITSFPRETDCIAALRKLLGRKKKNLVNRNGHLIQFKLPTVSESFPKPACGPFTDELKVVTYQALNDKAAYMGRKTI